MAWVMTGIALVLVIALGPIYGWVRAVIGVGIGFSILAFGFKYWRDVGLIPPEPELTDVSDQGLKYVCTMCGLELKVEVASKDKAPTHCMEPMVLERAGGTPPLRSL